MRMTLKKILQHHRFLCCIAALALTLASNARAQSKSQWVSYGADGALIYKKTPAGDRIMDFSHAGYHGGGVALPDVPVRERVKPPANDSTDATDLIQAAIDKVSALAPDANGFRGAVLLEPGVFVCAKTLTISDSGVVLRGSGSGARDAKSASIIRMTGGKHAAIVAGERGGRRGGGERNSALAHTKITEAYLPAGSISFTVADASGFKAGDFIEVRKTATAPWIHFMRMDDLVREGKPQTWIKAGTALTADRVVVSVGKNVITLTVPLPDSYDSKFSPAVVTKIPRPARMRETGIEFLRIESPPQAVNHTQELYTAVRLNGEDCWMRDVVAAETMNSISVGGHRITVQRVSVIRKALHPGASKPAEFAPNGGQVLLDRCSVEGDNIWFAATGGPGTGPIVLLNCFFKGRGDIEGHQRWTTGMLLDNCVVQGGGITIKNRGSMGSGHGWSLGWSVAWNCVAKSFTVQQPPGACNWAIGCIGERVLAPRPFDKEPKLPEGVFESHGEPVAPGSLYLAQLQARLGAGALRALGYDSPAIGKDNKLAAQNAQNPGQPFADKELGVDLAWRCPIGATSVRTAGDGAAARTFPANYADDGDGATYWAAADNALPARLEVDMESPVEIDAALLNEPKGLEHVRAFKLEGQTGDGWKLLSEGTKIGARKVLRFAPVAVWKVRLTVLQSEEYPAIAELGVFNTGGGLVGRSATE